MSRRQWTSTSPAVRNMSAHNWILTSLTVVYLKLPSHRSAELIARIWRFTGKSGRDVERNRAFSSFSCFSFHAVSFRVTGPWQLVGKYSTRCRWPTKSRPCDGTAAAVICWLSTKPWAVIWALSAGSASSNSSSSNRASCRQTPPLRTERSWGDAEGFEPFCISSIIPSRSRRRPALTQRKVPTDIKLLRTTSESARASGQWTRISQSTNDLITVDSASWANEGVAAPIGQLSSCRTPAIFRWHRVAHAKR